MESIDHDLLVEIKGKLESLETKMDDRLKNLDSKMDERKATYLTLFDIQEKGLDKNAKDVNEAFSKIHAMEKDLTKNNETTSSLADRVEKLEIAVVSMKETLIKVSVISTFMTAAITAAVVEFFGR